MADEEKKTSPIVYNDEYFNRFYQAYPLKTAKGQAFSSWKKLTKDMDKAEKEVLATQMVLAIEAQVKYRREAESKGEFEPPWKHPSTWLTSHCWLDEIKSHHELRQRHELKKCQHEGCEQLAHGPKLKFCAYHLAQSAPSFQILRIFYAKNGMKQMANESREDWLARLRITAKGYLKRFMDNSAKEG